MKRLLAILGLTGLGMVLVPVCLAYAGTLERVATNRWLLAGTILWFAASTAREHRD